MRSPFDLKVNPSYTQGRFNNTIVMHNGLPTMVTEIDRDLQCICRNMEGGFRANLTDEKFSFAPIPIGYVGNRENLTFLSRNPSRQWKQGISPNSLTPNTRNFSYNVESLVMNSVFVGTAKGNYDKIGESHKYSLHYKVLSRTIAITDMNKQDGAITYRGKIIGTIEGKDALLMGRQKFLLESLEELGINVINP